MKILLADDHTLVRQSVAKLLTNAGFEVVAEAGSGSEAVSMAELHQPDLVLLDVSMPGEFDGIVAADRIRRAHPDVRVILLTMHDDRATLSRASDLGVDGYVSKSSSTEEVVKAVVSVADGGTWVSSQVAAQMMEFARGSQPRHELTEREVEILERLAHGSRVNQIADALFVSPKTVKNHLSSIYTKLQVETAAQAVARAYQNGIVTS